MPSSLIVNPEWHAPAKMPSRQSMPVRLVIYPGSVWARLGLQLLTTSQDDEVAVEDKDAGHVMYSNNVTRSG
jgi:hypothetical protein